MKIRSGFVSNSSSSSFILNDLSLLSPARDYRHKYVQLTDAQLLEIEKTYPSVIRMSRPVYLTEYVSDGGDLHWRLYDAARLAERHVAVYMDGNHGYTYSEELYDELINGVWILKEHNK